MKLKEGILVAFDQEKCGLEIGVYNFLGINEKT